jgi:hypothetical protein
MSEKAEPAAFAASPEKGPAGPAEVAAAMPTQSTTRGTGAVDLRGAVPA